MKKIVLLTFVIALPSLAVVVEFARSVTVSLPPLHNIDTDLHYATIQEAINTTHDYDGLWHTTDFTITLVAEDTSGVAETYYKINDSPTKTISADGQPYITTESANNTLEYWSVDINGTEEPHHILTDIKLDKTPPKISITSPRDGAEVRSSPLIVWNGTDATSGIHHYEIRLDDGSWKFRCAACTFYTFIDPGDGSHTVEIKAFDKAGNSQVASVNFTVNTSPVGGPGYVEEQAIIIVVVLVALATATYFLKFRKKT